MRSAFLFTDDWSGSSCELIRCQTEGKGLGSHTRKGISRRGTNIAKPYAALLLLAPNRTVFMLHHLSVPPIPQRRSGSHGTCSEIR
jgi:hypothetical protein